MPITKIGHPHVYENRVPLYIHTYNINKETEIWKLCDREEQHLGT